MTDQDDERAAVVDDAARRWERRAADVGGRKEGVVGGHRPMLRAAAPIAYSPKVSAIPRVGGIFGPVVSIRCVDGYYPYPMDCSE